MIDLIGYESPMRNELTFMSVSGGHVLAPSTTNSFSLGGIMVVKRSTNISGKGTREPHKTRSTYYDLSVLREFGVYMSKTAHAALLKIKEERRRSLVKKLIRVAIARYDRRSRNDANGTDFRYCPHCGHYQSKYSVCLCCSHDTVVKYPISIRDIEDLEEVRKVKEQDLIEFDNLYYFDRGPWKQTFPQGVGDTKSK